jgi:hypothetical protein
VPFKKTSNHFMLRNEHRSSNSSRRDLHVRASNLSVQEYVWRKQAGAIG